MDDSNRWILNMIKEDEKNLERTQRTGEWIKSTGMAPPEFTGRYICSECGRYALMRVPYGNRQELSNHCPHCGARMVNSNE